MRKTARGTKKTFRFAKQIARSPKLTVMARRQRAKKMRTVFLWVLGLSVAGIFGYFLFFSPFSRITEMSVHSRTSSAFETEVQAAIFAYEEERKGFLFSKKNFFFFSCADMRSRLEGQFPSLAHIVVEKKFPNAVSVSFAERSPVAKWCSPRRCLLLDREGYAFAEDERVVVDGTDAFPVIADDAASDDATETKMPVRQEVLDRTLAWDDFLHSRLHLAGAVRYFVEAKTFEEYRIRTENGWDMRIAKDGALEETFETLRAFLETLPAERRDALESIDLRVSGKVFFTEKKKENAEGAQVDPQSTGEKIQTAEDGSKKEMKKEKNEK